MSSGDRETAIVHVFRHPGRYMDERGRQMWQAVTRIIDEADGVDLRATDQVTWARLQPYLCAPDHPSYLLFTCRSQ